MYNGLEIIDFHVHFPTQAGWIIERGPNERQLYVERLGERRAKIAREHAMNYNRQWRATWGFDPPERNSYTDEETSRSLGGRDRALRLARGGFSSPAAATRIWPASSSGTRTHSSVSPIITYSVKARTTNCAAPSMRMV